MYGIAYSVNGHGICAFVPVGGNTDQQDVCKSSSEVGVGFLPQLRKSTGVKQPPKSFEFESYEAERPNALFSSCTSYVGLLTKLQGAIQKLMDHHGKVEGLRSKQHTYDEYHDILIFCNPAP